MILKDFRSWGEYREALKAVPSSYDVSGGNGRWWCDAQDVGVALDLADRGWPEGQEYVRKITTPAVTSMAGRLEHADLGFDVTGASFDVGEYLAGTPECWINPLHTAAKPCVTISMHTSTSGSISADVLRTRGAAVVALTLALQQSGYAVQVYAIDGGTVDDSQTIWIRTCLTDSGGGPLDTDRLLFALAHPAAARQLTYSLEILYTGYTFNRPHRLGWAREGGSSARPPEEWKTDLYLHASHWDDRDWTSPEAVGAWVVEMYEQLTKGGDRY